MRTVPEDAILIPEKAQRVFKGVIFDVYQWEQELYDGSMATFERLKRPDTVLILSIKGDRICFVYEEQPGGRKPYTGLPGGRVDEGEEWLVAAKRECAEELGLTFNSWRLINAYQPVSKMEWFVATYLAWDCAGEGETNHDPGEKITAVEYTFDEAKAFAVGLTDPTDRYVQTLFANAQSIDDLLNLPAFKGKEIA